MVPSRVLLGLMLGKIKFLPKTFPKTKAKISERTEIIKAEKKIALVKESFITWTKTIFVKIAINKTQIKIFNCLLFLKSS